MEQTEHLAATAVRSEGMYRRAALRGGLAAAALLPHGLMAQTGTARKVIPWADQPAAVPPPLQNVVKNQTPWEALDNWVTPNAEFFSIAHYNRPVIDAGSWRLDVAGMVEAPLSLKLDDIKGFPRQEIFSTIECGGNNGLPFLTSAIGNAQWAGASLSEVLRRAGIRNSAIEVVFYGADQGEEVIRKDTPLELKFTGTFARSMSLLDAMSPANMLCYEMNGSQLPAANGYPLRLIAPGWFGVCNVKWLRRIELRDTRFMGRFMGRDYVTVREVQTDGGPIVEETAVGRMLLKSAPARVTVQDGRYRIEGMAWGPTLVTAVEVRVDDGPWQKATLDDAKSDFTWRSWHIDWSPRLGEHTITSRATDRAGDVQPAMDDPLIRSKKTYWESNGQITRSIRIA